MQLVLKIPEGAAYDYTVDELLAAVGKGKVENDWLVKTAKTHSYITVEEFQRNFLELSSKPIQQLLYLVYLSRPVRTAVAVEWTVQDTMFQMASKALASGAVGLPAPFLVGSGSSQNSGVMAFFEDGGFALINGSGEIEARHRDEVVLKLVQMDLIRIGFGSRLNGRAYGFSAIGTVLVSQNFGNENYDQGRKIVAELSQVEFVPLKGRLVKGECAWCGMELVGIAMSAKAWRATTVNWRDVVGHLCQHCDVVSDLSCGASGIRRRWWGGYKHAVCEKCLAPNPSPYVIFPEEAAKKVGVTVA